VGVSTLFVRFGECDLRCAWCDSPHTWKPAMECRIEQRPGSGSFRRVANPVSIDEVVRAADELAAGSHRFVSLTGGEPLLQPEAARELAAALRERQLRVYLETHGLASQALRTLVELCDVVSMDWKLASDVRREADPAGGPVEDFHSAHREFLEVARAAGEVFVKVVVTRNTRDEELEQLCRELAECAPDTLLVLQPVTPFARVRERPSAGQLLAWTRLCSRRLPDVRLIPQTHPSYGAL
jgi:organic radical activating enzyme